MPEATVISATGNLMVAEALRQAEPDVIAAYPITPQTAIVEAYAKYVADGRVHTEFVTVESEHSSMSACIGSAAAGARTSTATSSQGLAYMWEELHIAAGMRLPIVMANANRALSAPINIHCDHSDVMGARDTGWIILFAETAQEAYDNTVMAFRIAENPAVRLPVMTTLDGFITTHAMERAELLDDATVKDFIGSYDPIDPLLDTARPVSAGMFADGKTFSAVRLQMRRAIEASKPIIKQVGDEWAGICGRPFEFINTWGTEDADEIVICIGSATGNVRHVARQLRAEGRKVGVVGVRVFRPFPYEEVARACAGAKAIAIMDRSDSIGGHYAPLGMEVRTALYDLDRRIPTRNYVYGLGGSDVPLSQIRHVFDDVAAVSPDAADPGIVYLGIN